VADTIEVTVNLSPDGWTIEADVIAHAVLPTYIFLYENSGQNVLGRYFGVCNFKELSKYQEWQGTAVPQFGNKFVRHNHAKITLPISSDPNSTVSNLINTAKALKQELSSVENTTTVYTI
jgi:hypothetical protein